MVEELQAFEFPAQGGDPVPHAKIVTVKKVQLFFKRGLSKERLLLSTIHIPWNHRIR